MRVAMLMTLTTILLLLPLAAGAGEKAFTEPWERDFPKYYHELDTDPETGEPIKKIFDDETHGPQENFGVVVVHDNRPFATFSADRLEWQWGDEGEDLLLWDVVTWFGNDYNKLYFESEGKYLEKKDKIGEGALELLYGRSVASFWDVRAGVRYDIEPDPERAFLTVGVLGLAPLQFEVDANTYISEDGDISADIEMEYEILLTQRLHLVPRLKVGASLQDVPEYETWQGITGVTLGARLMYQIRREFAPYIGVTWQRKTGETGNNLEEDGKDIDSSSLILGVRFWF